MSKNMEKTAYTLPPMTKIEIFINEMNMITILETDHMMEQSLVILETKERAQQVARAILSLSKITSFKSNPEKK